jgi:hypothetical protein
MGKPTVRLFSIPHRRGVDMEIKEKPILFSGPMVRAILRGDKTQTRRVINPQPDSEEEGEPYWNIGGFRLHQSSSKPLICPYGNPGDILWVREAWRGSRENDKIHLSYCADGKKRILDSNSAKHNLSDYIFPRAASNPKNAVSPLFMPRWASRITLKITEKAREAPPFRAGRDRAEREACHVVAFRTQHS